MTTAQKLTKLNELHAILGRKIFTSWKKSAANLDKRIEDAALEVADLKAADAQKSQEEIEANELATEKATLLASLNKYRAVMGIRAAPEWQGSIADLRSAITQIKADHLEMIRSEEAHAKMSKKRKTVSIPSLASTKAPKDDRKPTKAQAKEHAQKVAKAIGAPTSLLPSIAAELGINPKVARQKLRKAHGSDWHNLSAKDLKKFLKGR